MLMWLWYDFSVSRCFRRSSASSSLVSYNKHWMWFTVWCALLLWVMESAENISSADDFDPTWFICEEVTLCIMICCAQELFLSQLSVPMRSMASLGLGLHTVPYRLMAIYRRLAYGIKSTITCTVKLNQKFWRYGTRVYTAENGGMVCIHSEHIVNFYRSVLLWDHI